MQSPSVSFKLVRAMRQPREEFRAHEVQPFVFPREQPSGILRCISAKKFPGLGWFRAGFVMSGLGAHSLEPDPRLLRAQNRMAPRILERPDSTTRQRRDQTLTTNAGVIPHCAMRRIMERMAVEKMPFAIACELLKLEIAGADPNYTSRHVAAAAQGL